MKSKIVFLIIVLSLFASPQKNWMVEAQESPGSISFTPSAIPEIEFEYNPQEYQFELTWKSYYLNIKPFAIYQGEYYDLKTIIPWLKNNYPNVDYRTAADKFKNYHRWGFWLEKLPQNVADNLDYLGFDVSDTNIPLSVVEVETIEDGPFPFKRIHIGGRFSMDFYDLYERGFEVTLNKTTILIGNVEGKTDLDLDPITYSTPSIIVTGFSAGSPCTFWDVWNASNVEGWGAVHNNRLNGTQYQFDSRLIIGDGVIETFFNDTNKQVFFNENCTTAINENFISTEEKGHLRLGWLEDADLKATRRGVSLIFDSAYSNCRAVYGEIDSSVELYSSLFEGVSNNVRVLTRENARIWNCYFQNEARPVSTTDTDFYNVHVAGQDIASCSGTFEKIFVTSWSKALTFYHDLGGNITDLYSRDISVNLISITGPRIVDTYLIDADVEEWTFVYGGAASTGEVYRAYTFNVLVVNKDGNPVENVDIALTYSGLGGGTAYTGTTPVNGSIPEQIISKGFYNETGGNTIYPYEPYNLTISKIGYESTILIFNVSEPIDWTIALVEESIDVIVNQDMVLFIFAALSLITFIGMLIAKNLVISVSAAVVSFVCWSVTAIYYLYENSAFPGPGVLFMLFAAISLIYAVYAGLKLVNPYERERLEEI